MERRVRRRRQCFAQVLDDLARPDLGRVVQRVEQQRVLVLAHGDEILPPVDRELPDADLADQGLAHHHEGLRRERAVWCQVVAAIDEQGME